MSDDLLVDLGPVESASLKFKRQAEDRQEIRRAICALANDLPGLGGAAGAAAVLFVAEGFDHDGVVEGT